MSNKTCHELTEVVQEIPEGSKHFVVETGYINCAYHQHFISVGVFQDKQCTIPVHPTAGRYVVEATDDGYQWGEMFNGDIKANDPHYKRPNMCGYVASVRVNVSDLDPTHDIHGNYFFRVRVHSYM